MKILWWYYKYYKYNIYTIENALRMHISINIFLINYSLLLSDCLFNYMDKLYLPNLSIEHDADNRRKNIQIILWPQ